MGIKEDGYATFNLKINIKVTKGDMIRYKLKQLTLKRYRYRQQGKIELN